MAGRIIADRMHDYGAERMRPMGFKISRQWQELEDVNKEQLARYGYRNFKRTVSKCYFTGTNGLRNPADRFLFSSLPKLAVARHIAKALYESRKPQRPFTRIETFLYDLFTLMLWDYTRRRTDILDRITEPLEGNPPELYEAGRLISQDLAHSALDYLSIAEGVDMRKVRHVMEIGAGYGRTAYLILRLHPKIRYTIVDIQPALALSKRYLKNQLPSSRIRFLSPSQIKSLGDKSVDLCINISSFHEMPMETIREYFMQINRVVDGWVYMMELKEGELVYEKTKIRENDYPIPKGWKRLYKRNQRPHVDFFEALYKID